MLRKKGREKGTRIFLDKGTRKRLASFFASSCCSISSCKRLPAIEQLWNRILHATDPARRRGGTHEGIERGLDRNPRRGPAPVP